MQQADPLTLRRHSTLGVNFRDITPYEVAIYSQYTALHVHELLANRRYDRILDRLQRLVFTSWRTVVFTAIYERDYKVGNHIRKKVLSKVFRAWGRLTCVEKIMGKLVRRHWRRKRRHAFALWKWSSRFAAYKLKLLDKAFVKLHSHAQLRLNIAKKWRYLYQCLAARVVQRAFRRFKLRQLFWSMKCIKRFIMKRKCLALLKYRKANEIKRGRTENETISILFRRVQVCYDDFLVSDTGQAMLQEYIGEVNRCLEMRTTSSTVPMKVLPTSAEMQSVSISSLGSWTLKSKCVRVLWERCRDTIQLAAVKRYRKLHPPRYECLRCFRTFLLKVEHLDHCKYRCGEVFVGKHTQHANHSNAKTLLHRGAILRTRTDINGKHGGSLGATHTLLLPGQATQILDAGVDRSRPHWSRIYSRNLSTTTKYSYKKHPPEYHSAILCQPLVEAILRPISTYLSMDLA
jgi:hypothetical protein